MYDMKSKSGDKFFKGTYAEKKIKELKKKEVAPYYQPRANESTKGQSKGKASKK